MRVRWPFTIAWTLLCLFALASAVDLARKPVEPGCWEYCGLDAELGTIIAAGIVLVWLVVVLVGAWIWTRATRIPCPRCGRPIDEPSRFCQACSYDLLESLESPGGGGDESDR